jgi:TolA-binding protein
MGTPEVKLRVTDPANEALKSVVARFPKWSIAQLADSIIQEACAAILREEGDVSLPTLDYVRSQIHPHKPGRDDRLIKALDDMQEQINSLQSTILNEEPDVPPPRKRKAG